MGVKSRTKTPPSKRRKSKSKSKSKRGKSKKTNTSKNPQEAFFKKYCNGAFQSKLLEGMNELIRKMAKSTDKKENNFVKNLGTHLKKIKFLTFKNNKIELKKEKSQKGGDPDDDDKKEVCENTGQIITSMPPSNETNPLSILTQQMNALSTQLTNYRIRPDANQSVIMNLQNQLTNMTMVHAAVQQRQQAIGIVKNRAAWQRLGNVCNILLQLTFTGLAGYLSYLVVTLVEGAATFINTGATGIFMLFCISIFQIFISLVNGVTNRLPSYMGGGNVFDRSGRELAYNITNTIQDGMRETPELMAAVGDLRNLGYTTNIIAFMILFVMFMIIMHFTRIFMTARQLSIGWTGISMNDGTHQLQTLPTNVQVPQLQNANNANNPRLAPSNAIANPPNAAITNNMTPSQIERARLDHISQQFIRDNVRQNNRGGGYKKNKKKTKKKKNKKSKKTKKARKKRR